GIWSGGAGAAGKVVITFTQQVASAGKTATPSRGLMWEAAMLLAEFSSGFGGSGVIASPDGSASIDMLGWSTTPASATDRSRVTPSGDWTIQWMVTDQLGTPRIILDQTGNFSGVTRHDYLPFGEELFAGTGGRTTAQGYSASDGIRQHFTQKERDIETGLDYFLARYYSSTEGRFASPDEFAGGPDELFSFANNASENPTFYAD